MIVSATANQGGSRTLLVVDDEAGVRFAMQYALEGKFRVICEASGRAAIERIRTEAIDGLLIDVNMPIMNGFEAVEQMNALGYSVPFWFMTAVVPSAVLERAGALKAWGIFRKPFDIQRLRAELDVIGSGAPPPPVMAVHT